MTESSRIISLVVAVGGELGEDTAYPTRVNLNLLSRSFSSNLQGTGILPVDFPNPESRGLLSLSQRPGSGSPSHKAFHHPWQPNPVDILAVCFWTASVIHPRPLVYMTHRTSSPMTFISVLLLRTRNVLPFTAVLRAFL